MKPMIVIGLLFVIWACGIGYTIYTREVYMAREHRCILSMGLTAASRDWCEAAVALDDEVFREEM